MCSFTLLFGAYDIHLGVYKSKQKLHEEIVKIQDMKYRKHIDIFKFKHLYRAHAVYNDKQSAIKALVRYKKVFSDAYIDKKHVKEQKKSKILTYAKKGYVRVHMQILEAKTLLKNKTVYVCNVQGPKHLKERISKMVFSESFVMYHPLKQTSTPVKWSCTFIDNHIDFTLLGMKMKHTLYKRTEDYIAIESQVEGKDTHKMRYYFDKKKALSFVQEKVNDSVAP